MQDWIARKLEQIDELYPPERVARSRARWEALWANQKPDRYPFQYQPALLSYYDDVHTPEQRLRLTLEEILLHGYTADDFVPSIFPGLRQGTLPNMLGAKEVVLDGDYTCQKLIQSPADVAHLVDEPVLGPGSLARHWLDMQQYFLDQTEGRLPVHVVDMQGPADVAAQIWSYDGLLLAAYTDPEAYHRVMGLATAAFLAFWKAQRQLLGPQFVATHLFGWNWVPADCGASLSADSLVMVSADFYREFYQPYLCQIAEALGGLAIHSCGNWSHMVKPVCQTPGVRSINVSQMSLEMLLKAGLSKSTVVTAIGTLDQVASTYQLVKVHDLKVDLSISGVLPGGLGPPTEWPTSAWDDVRQQEEMILDSLP